MRDFKYQIWDKPNKQWVKQPYSINQVGQLQVKDIVFIDNDDFEVCQYTGLKDKNSKEELFEGDVIKFRTFDGIGYIGYIEWDDEEMCYAVSTTDSHAPYLLLLQNVISFESIKKLGNIYENTELIKD